ncbi:prominin-1-A isoform X2 [Genypterus blacodes]|uniref:prominin-1-A isoform X2 n=1 Tax=Genypterus blacodes TaxID=154954 RepID=UPI003F75F89F
MMWKPAALLLLCGLVCGELQQETESQRRQTPAEKLDFGYVPVGVYETVAHYEPGPIRILFEMVHAFLCVVQPNPFPKDAVVKLAKDRKVPMKGDFVKMAYYEMGFLVCAALGLLFTVLMPIVGLFFCMCRCCDNCGGEMHQRQRKNADCQRGLLGTLLFFTSLIITLGVLCAYAANQNMSSQMVNAPKLAKSNLRDLHNLFNGTTVQVDYLLSQYATAKNKVIHDLNHIGPLLGGGIRDEFTKEASPALEGAHSLATAMRETKKVVENSSVSLYFLQDAILKLNDDLSQVRGDINRTLNDNDCQDAPDATTAQLCKSIHQSLPQLQMKANFSRLHNLASVRERMESVLSTNLVATIQTSYASLNDIPLTVAHQTRGVVHNVQTLLDDHGVNVTSLTKVFPLTRHLDTFIKYINTAHAKIEDFYKRIDQQDFYRWITCVVLCCMLVLILAFNYLGLLCGTLGYDKHASPTTRGCISNTGGTMLMAAVGFSFIFSWLLMVLVTAVFVIGGNMEKLICQPYHTKELFKVVDTPYLVNPEWKYFIPGFIYGDSDLELTLENLYRDCKEDKGIYAAIRLEKLFNVSSYLNKALFTGEIADQFDSLEIDVGVNLSEQEMRQNLLNFSKVGLSKINYADFQEELSNVAVLDLLVYANELEDRADLMPSGPLQTALKVHVQTLRQIHRQHIVNMVQSTTTLNQSMHILEQTASNLPHNVSYVIHAIDNLITYNKTHVIKQETEKYKGTLVGYFQQYIEWVKMSLAMDVATCKPFSNALDSVEIIACSYIVDSMNSIWMGLGCCTLFLLPSIILGVKLAKHYRRMDTEDVYDDLEIGNNGYHRENLQGIPFPITPSIPAVDTMNRFPRASAPPRHIDW